MRQVSGGTHTHKELAQSITTHMMRVCKNAMKMKENGKNKFKEKCGVKM